MPEKSNFFLRARARNVLRGQGQTALLVMLASSALQLLSQVTSYLAGNDLQQVLLTAVYQANDAELSSPSYWLSSLSVLVEGKQWLPNVLTVLNFLVAPMLTLGAVHFFLSLLRGDREQSWTAVFSRASSWLKGLGLELLVILKCILWTLPGLAGLTVLMLLTSSMESLSGYGASWIVTLSIACYIAVFALAVIAALRYALSRYFLADHPEKGIRECIADSKKAMEGHKLSLVGMEFSFLAWQIAISYFANAIYSLFGTVLYYVLSLGLSLALNMYRTCSLCAFYQVWGAGETGKDPLQAAGDESTVV